MCIYVLQSRFVRVCLSACQSVCLLVHILSIRVMLIPHPSIRLLLVLHQSICLSAWLVKLTLPV